jgi:hypothetical protein
MAATRLSEARVSASDLGEGRRGNIGSESNDCTSTPSSMNWEVV